MVYLELRRGCQRPLNDTHSRALARGGTCPLRAPNHQRRSATPRCCRSRNDDDESAQKRLSPTAVTVYYLWRSPGNLYLTPGWDSEWFPECLGRGLEHVAVAKPTIFLSVTTGRTGSGGGGLPVWLR